MKTINAKAPNVPMRGYGRCLIPADNTKQYGKVIKQLRKDKIPFDESFVDEATWGQLTTTNGICHDNAWRVITPVRTNGSAIIITYGRETK